MKKIWEKIITVFDALFSKLFEEKKPETETPAEVLESIKYDTHNYGLETANILLASGDFGWEIKPFKKTVLLANTDKCANKLTLMGMFAQWHGTGHSEWECLLAVWFIEAVKEAFKSKECADITILFNRDLTSAAKGTFTHKEIYNHLIKSFEIISEDKDTILVSLKNPQ